MGRLAKPWRRSRQAAIRGTGGDAPRHRAFEGAGPRGRPEVIADAMSAGLEPQWRTTDRYNRRAEVVETAALTSTGTVRITFRVGDGLPFSFLPGQFVGIQADVAGAGRRHSPYCIMSPPSEAPMFELVVRVVPNGPLSGHLSSLRPGDVVAFRGPTGRSMLPRHPECDLVLLATGVGLAPFYSLARGIFAEGFDRPVRLFWGLRQVEDLCLLDELDALARDNPNFSYRVSLSQPPDDWTGLRGRLTESVPPLLSALGSTQFHLCGNGAMTEELGVALSDMGVAEEFIYREPYFNARHRPDPAVMDAIRSRFVARDLFSPYAHQQAELFHLERPLGNASPLAPSDVARRVEPNRLLTPLSVLRAPPTPS